MSITEDDLILSTIDRSTNACTSLAIGGTLDGDNCHQLTNAIPVDGTDVNLDLSGLTFIDSSGISTLLVLHRQVGNAGGRLTVSGARGQVARVFEITMVADHLGADQQR